jgi:hypothetical protein
VRDTTPTALFLAPDGRSTMNRPRRRKGLLDTEPAELELSVATDSGADAEEVERLVRSLRLELSELELDGVEPIAADPPPGTRAAEAIVAGALLVKLVRTSAALTTLVRAVRGWVGPRGDRRVRLELDGDVLELTGASEDERERLIEAWIERHARG